MGKYKLDDKQNKKLLLIGESAGLELKEEEGIPLLNEIMDQLEDTDIVSEKAFKKLPISIQNFYNAVADIDLEKYSSEDEEKLDTAFGELDSLKSAGKGGKKDKDEDAGDDDDKGKGKGKKKSKAAEKKEPEAAPKKSKRGAKKDPEPEGEKEEEAPKGKKKSKAADAKDTRAKDFPIGSFVDYVGKKANIDFKKAKVVGYCSPPGTGVIIEKKDGKKHAVTPKTLALFGKGK